MASGSFLNDSNHHMDINLSHYLKKYTFDTAPVGPTCLSTCKSFRYVPSYYAPVTLSFKSSTHNCYHSNEPARNFGEAWTGDVYDSQFPGIYLPKLYLGFTGGLRRFWTCRSIAQLCPEGAMAHSQDCHSSLYTRTQSDFSELHLAHTYVSRFT